MSLKTPGQEPQHVQQSPINQQPLQGASSSACVPGLEYLTTVDQLLVKQQLELLEIFTSIETANKYQILNSVGQNVYYAAEISDCCMRNLCGGLRSFDMVISDNYGREVIHLERPLRCQTCFYPCCLQEMTVYAPPGQVIGTIKQLCNPLRPKFAIFDHMDNKVLYIRGSICQCQLCCDINFKVLALDQETEVGCIARQRSGLLKEVVIQQFNINSADNFGVTFPFDLDVRVKATLLASAFLIDFMYFEQRKEKQTSVQVDDEDPS